MDKKERMDLILSKIPEADKKKSEGVTRKYNVVIPEEELKGLRESAPQKLSAEDLKNLSGGDRCDCWGGGICSCVCCYWY